MCDILVADEIAFLCLRNDLVDASIYLRLFCGTVGWLT